MVKTKSDEVKYAELDDFIGKISEKDGVLITTLHKAQSIFGYLPVDVQNHISRKLDIPASKVFGVVTFYSFFNMEPKGTYQINVCMGTACFVRGSQNIIDALEKEIGIKVGQISEDGMFSLDSLRCVGACGLAPVVSVNGKVYGRVTQEHVKGIVEENLAKGEQLDE